MIHLMLLIQLLDLKNINYNKKTFSLHIIIMSKRKLEEEEPEEEHTKALKSLTLDVVSQEILNQINSGVMPQNTEEHEIRIWNEDQVQGKRSIVVPVEVNPDTIITQDEEFCCSDCPEYSDEISPEFSFETMTKIAQKFIPQTNVPSSFPSVSSLYSIGYLNSTYKSIDKMDPTITSQNVSKFLSVEQNNTNELYSLGLGSQHNYLINACHGNVYYTANNQRMVYTNPLPYQLIFAAPRNCLNWSSAYHRFFVDYVLYQLLFYKNSYIERDITVTELLTTNPSTIPAGFVVEANGRLNPVPRDITLKLSELLKAFWSVDSSIAKGMDDPSKQSPSSVGQVYRMFSLNNFLPNMFQDVTKSSVDSAPDQGKHRGIIIMKNVGWSPLPPTLQAFFSDRSSVEKLHGFFEDELIGGKTEYVNIVYALNHILLNIDLLDSPEEPILFIFGTSVIAPHSMKRINLVTIKKESGVYKVKYESYTDILTCPFYYLYAVISRSPPIMNSAGGVINSVYLDFRPFQALNQNDYYFTSVVNGRKRVDKRMTSITRVNRKSSCYHFFLRAGIKISELFDTLGETYSFELSTYLSSTSQLFTEISLTCRVAYSPAGYVCQDVLKRSISVKKGTDRLQYIARPSIVTGGVKKKRTTQKRHKIYKKTRQNKKAKRIKKTKCIRRRNYHMKKSRR